MVQIGRGYHIDELPNASLPFYADIDTMLEEALAGDEITPRAQLNVIDSGMLASARELYGAPGERPVETILKTPNVIGLGGRRNRFYLPAPQIVADYFTKGQHTTGVGIRVGIEALEAEAGLGVVSRIRPKAQAEVHALHHALEGIIEDSYGPGQWRERQFLRTNIPLLAGLAVQQAGVRRLPHLAYKSLRLFHEAWKDNGMHAIDYPPVLGRLAVGIRTLNTERTASIMLKALRDENDPAARRAIERTIVQRHGEAILALAGQFSEELPPPQRSVVKERLEQQQQRERIYTSRSFVPTDRTPRPDRSAERKTTVTKPSDYDTAILEDPGKLMGIAAQTLKQEDFGSLLIATMALSEQYDAGDSIALQAYPGLWQLVRVRLFNHVYRNRMRISEGRVTPAEALFIKTINEEVDSPISNELYDALTAGALAVYKVESRAMPIRKLTTEAFIYNLLNARAAHAAETERDWLLLAKIQAHRAVALPGLRRTVEKAGFKAHHFVIPLEVEAAVKDAKRRPKELRRAEATVRQRR